jgi:putative transposase
MSRKIRRFSSFEDFRHAPQLGPHLKPVNFQHQAHDHVLTEAERERNRFTLHCVEYVLLNPVKEGLVGQPDEWPFSGAVVPGYPRANPFDEGFWDWLWIRYADLREPGIERRVLPPRGLA